MTEAGKSDELIDASLLRSAEAVRAFGVGQALAGRIADLERVLAGKDRDAAAALVADDGIGTEDLLAALTVKAAAGQIDVVVHALGILVSLPYLLDEGELIESLSLGAGNTGRPHDLETDRRIAEFKFVTWRGADAARQKSLFVDLFNLASSDTAKRRELYVLDKHVPLRFLNGRSAIERLLNRNDSARVRFDQRHAADGFVTVRQYWATVRDRVELIDLRDRVPTFSAQAIAMLDEADGVPLSS